MDINPILYIIMLEIINGDISQKLDKAKISLY